MPQIIVHRHTKYFGVLRKLDVFVDGQKATQIPNDGRVVINTEPGQHEIYVKMDWCASRPIALNLGDDSSVEMEAGCGDWKALTAFFEIFFRGRDFFYMRILSPVAEAPREGVWPPPIRTG